MYEIRKDVKVINGTKIRTFARDVRKDLAVYEFEAGTTGFEGEDTKAYIGISASIADFFARVLKDKDGDPSMVEIVISTEEDLRAMIDGLLFVTQALVEQCTGEDE